MPRAVTRRRQRHNRTVACHGPAPREAKHWRTIEVEQLGGKPLWHGRYQGTHQAARKPRDRSPFVPRDPDAARIERGQPAVGVFDVMKFIGEKAPPVDGTLGLDVFSGHAVTVVPGTAIVIETPKSLAARTATARELPARLVRDAEGVSLTVNGAVQTPQGTAWMELDTGNSSGLFVGNHIAPLLGMKPDTSSPVGGSVTLANGIVVSGPTRTANLIMDGNIGAEFLNHWILTLDLDTGRAWLSAYKAEKKAGD